MPPPPPPPSAELLMEHRSFLQGLSRSLVVDEQRAEDVVQQTYLAVLERPPPPTVRLRAWLGAIARNLALRSRRTEGRVRRREGKAARPDAVAATVDIAARVEIQRRVADAVAALPEPGRSAIVWRYFDGLTPTEIARRENVSVRTIESRLRRAREALRGRLDTCYESRASWQAALLPVTGWSTAAGTGWTTTATTGAQGGGSTASGVGAAAAVGVTIMNIKAVLGIVVVCAAGAFLAGRHLMPAPQPLQADTEDDAGAAGGPLLGSKALGRKQVEADLATAQAHSAFLEGEIRALREQLAAVARAEGAATARTSAGQVAYGPPAFVQTLAGIEWGAAGEAVVNLLPLLVKLEAAFRDVEEMSPKDVAGISRWNSPLVQLALSAQEGKLPGTTANGAFSHPAVMVNLIAAALERAKQPLSAAQFEMLSELGDRFVAEDERRLQGYGEDELVLQKTIEEAELKDRFYAGTDALLTTAQQEILHPPTLRGRLGPDLFSSGVIWHPLSKPVTFSTRAELAPNMAALLVAQLGIPAEQRPLVEDAAAAWARSFTEEELRLADDPVLRDSGKMSADLIAGWARIELARASARNMLALSRELLERLPADAPAVRRLRSAPYIAIPVKR